MLDLRYPLVVRCQGSLSEVTREFILLASVWGEATVCGISRLGVRSGSHLLHIKLELCKSF